jgi:hypothetical protein
LKARFSSEARNDLVDQIFLFDPLTHVSFLFSRKRKENQGEYKVKEVNRKEVRMAAVEALRARGYIVTDISAGQGVERFSRLGVEGQGERFTCLIKTATGPGRISFPRAKDGQFVPLANYDKVLHGWLIPGSGGKVKLSLFDRSVILDAFNKNQAQMDAKGMGHLPCWISPSLEVGWRFDGSGYEKDAVWAEVVDLRPETPEDHENPFSQSKAEQDGPEEVVVNERCASSASQHPPEVENASLVSVDIQREKESFQVRLAKLLSLKTSSVKVEITITF